MSGDASAPSMVPSDIRRTKFVRCCPTTGTMSVLEISAHNLKFTNHHIDTIALEMHDFDKFVDVYEGSLE